MTKVGFWIIGCFQWLIEISQFWKKYPVSYVTIEIQHFYV